MHRMMIPLLCAKLCPSGFGSARCCQHCCDCARSACVPLCLRRMPHPNRHEAIVPVRLVVVPFWHDRMKRVPSLLSAPHTSAYAARCPLPAARCTGWTLHVVLCWQEAADHKRCSQRYVWHCDLGPIGGYRGSTGSVGHTIKHPFAETLKRTLRAPLCVLVHVDVGVELTSPSAEYSAPTDPLNPLLTHRPSQRTHICEEK